MPLAEYILSLAENTTLHLTLFIFGTLMYFLGRVWLSYRAIRRARAKIPLVIGGWGTRGKSGTERIKAGLFHGLGVEVLVKTTGNEAMFIHTVPEAKPMELFIFRPYDKASIWEQHDLVLLAARLKVQVMMWECMALNPRYVRILEQVWMKDTITTLTNAYPDHEDIQGPAGFNIPEVMQNFIPVGGICFTAEEQMLPILEEGARRKGANLQATTWRDSAMITKDVLDRFPYMEHPSNIALVLRLGDLFEVPRDFALKEMADNVVPDVGVLKTYPIATYLGRKLEFTLGNSANERAGFMNNWTRTAFDRHNNVDNADVWICTVVNNRADRIPRSKVFAQILVMDIAAHRHFCIGTNLTGLEGYIRESFKQRRAGLFLIRPQDERPSSEEELRERVQQRFLAIMEEYKVESPTLEDVLRKFRAMMEGVGAEPSVVEALMNDPEIRRVVASTQANAEHLEDESNRVANDPELEETMRRVRKELASAGVDEVVADAIAEFFERYARTFRSVCNLWAFIEPRLADVDASVEEINERVRVFAERHFLSTVDPIMNSGATGDQIIDHIARCAPPGFTVRLMGAQNIKGTGLDFAYRWITLGKVCDALENLKSSDEKTRLDTVRWLGSFKEFGILDCPIAIETLRRCKTDENYQTSGAQQQVDSAIDHISAIYENRKRMLSEVTSRGRMSQVLEAVEQVFDTRDSRKRRRRANMVRKDLVDERISHEQAEYVLRDITKRQKGGWLERDLQRLFHIRHH
jgi:poly-gamma-glutamate synthase PgsB/CapB